MASKNTEIQDAVIRLKGLQDIITSMALLSASMSTVRQLLLYGIDGRDIGDDFDSEIWNKEFTEELGALITKHMETFF